MTTATSTAPPTDETRPVEPPTNDASPPLWVWTRPATAELVALGVLCLIVLIVGIVMVSQGAPLGHDESVYALRARYYAGQAQEMAWAAYRAEGLPLMAAPLVALGGSEPHMRMLVVVFTVLCVVLTWAVTRLLFNPRAGVIAAALVAVSPGLVKFSWMVLLDIPATAFGLAAALVLALAARGPRLEWFALWAVPLAIAGAATRYGAPLVIAAGMTGIGLARWRPLLRDWPRTLAVAGGSVAGMAAVLFVPWVTNSSSSPYVAFAGRQVDKGINATASYTSFVTLLDETFGFVVGGAIVLGIGAALVRHLPMESMLAATFATVALVVGMNLSLAEMFGQYLMPLIPFAAMLAGAGLASIAVTPTLTAIVVVALVGAGFLPAYRSAQESVDTTTDYFNVLRETGRSIDAATDDGECIVLTSYSPQVGWYSNCNARNFNRLDEGVDLQQWESELDGRFVVSAEAPWYVVFMERGKRQPEELVAGIRERYGPANIVGEPGAGSRQSGEIFRLDPP